MLFLATFGWTRFIGIIQLKHSCIAHDAKLSQSADRWPCSFCSASPSNVTLSGYSMYSDGVRNISVNDVLTCLAAGYPAVTYQWYWGDGVTDQVCNGSTLEVTELGLHNYACTATNALGSASTTVEIAVTGSYFHNVHVTLSSAMSLRLLWFWNC